MEFQGVTLQRKLAAARHWWRLTRVLSGLTWVLSLVVVLALICYHSDRLLVLSVHARENWRAGIALTAGVTLLLALAQPLLRKLSDYRVAAEVERRFPVLHERLLTTLDLAPTLSATNGASNGSHPYAHAFSEQMTTALAQETQKVASDLNFKRAVSLRPLRNGALTMVFTLALLFLHVFFAPEAFATWLRRMSDPHADIPPYAKTRVQVIPDVTLLPRGEGTYVTVKTWGDAVDRCVLRVHQDGEDPKAWTDVELKNPVPVAHANPDEKDARKFRYRFGTLARSISLVATANDGRSNERDVRVEDRPTLLNVRLTLHFPAYMHRKDQTLPETTGAIAAPIGTQVDVVGIANKPLKNAVFVHDNVDAGAWPVSGSQTSGHVGVSKDGTYRLKLVDTHNFANLNPPRYDIRAMKDEAPNVQILRPATDIDLVPGGSLPLIAHATDDYGISTAKLLYDTTHEDVNREGRNSLVHVGKGAFTLPADYGTPSVDIRQRWFISSVNPRVGDIIQYTVNGWDNDNLSGPHIGRSAAYRIRVVSTATMQGRLKEQLDAEQQALTSARQHQIEAQKQLAQARAKNDPTQMARAQEAQRSVAQETKALAQRVQDLSNQLENNNFATKSEMDRRQQAQQTLENSAQQKMSPAADKVQQAQNAKANSPERSQDLQQADQQQTAAKKDIERAQELLSRTQTAEQLAKDAQQAAQDQQRLADSSRSLAEDIKQQQQQNKNNVLTPEQKTALEMQRRQQAQVSDDTRKLEKQLDQAAQEAQQRGDNKQAEDLKRAADALKQGDAKGNQNQAQKNLGQNKPQQAAGAQDKAASALQKAAESAAKAAGQEKPTDPKTAAEKAEAAAQQLHELAKQQQELARQVGENLNSEQSKELGQKEQQIQQMAQQAQQNLEGAKAAQQSAQKAQQNLSQSQQKLSQNQPQGAKQPAKDAAKQLEDAAKQAERAAEQMRQQQQAQELADKVERLAQIQRALETTTKRVDNTLHAPKAAGHDLGAPTRERRQVAERQLKLEKETQELAQKVPSKAFQQALKMASGQMHTANENLNGKDLQGTDEPDAGKDTQKAQHRAAQTLDTVTQALKQQAQANNQQQQQQGQQQQGQQGSPEQQQAAEAAGELALAQGLQKQLRQDTGALDQQRAKNPNQTLTPEQQKDANQLTQGQKAAQEITQNAAKSLENAAPDAAQSAAQAGEHMDQAHQKLQQKQTGQPTQGQQDQAIDKLGQAQKQAEQAQQQQQQQQQQSQQEQQGAPKPGQKNGGKPGQNPFARLGNITRGEMSAPANRNGKGFSQLSGRDQRTLRDGENERVPAEYQDLVSRYYKGLAEKKR